MVAGFYKLVNILYCIIFIEKWKCMVCFCLNMPVTHAVQTHICTNIIYVFSLFRNIVEMIQTQSYNIQTSVDSEIIADLFCLWQCIRSDSHSGKGFFFLYIFRVVSIINFIWRKKNQSFFVFYWISNQNIDKMRNKKNYLSFLPIPTVICIKRTHKNCYICIYTFQNIIQILAIIRKLVFFKYSFIFIMSIFISRQQKNSVSLFS